MAKPSELSKTKQGGAQKRKAAPKKASTTKTSGKTTGAAPKKRQAPAKMPKKTDAKETTKRKAAAPAAERVVKRKIAPHPAEELKTISHPSIGQVRDFGGRQQLAE
jgi:hypothetical protein